MNLDWKNYRFEAEGDSLAIRQDGRVLMRLPVVPQVEGETLSPGRWHQLGEQHLCMEVCGLGRVNLAVQQQRPCYWLETERKHFSRLTYFPNSHPTDTGWHSFLSDELDRYWSLDENADVPLSSCYFALHVDGPDGAGMTDPGDRPPTWIWNIPPRAFAIQTPAGWVGFSVPGPLSVAVTRLTMNRGMFNLHFDELRPTAREWGPPRVYLVPGLPDPYDTLDEHRLISAACGLMVRREAAHPDWWSLPSFKAADEIFRLNGKQWVLNDGGNFTTYFTTENWLRWTEHVAAYAGLQGGMNLQVDQLFFHGYGARKVISTLGGNEGFRRTIDELRARGFRVGLYYHLYQLDPDATDFPARSPEAVCRPKDPSVIVRSGVPIGRNELVYADWTHPLARQYMLEMVEWLISDKPGCLNADILLINNTMGVDPRHFDFHDPDWGTGDLMQMKALRLVYEHAKRIKPHVLVRRQSPGDPFVQPYYDMANMCEEWNGHTRAWYRRAHIATRTLDNCLFHLDAWFVTLTKLTEYYFAFAVLCPPEIESVEHAIHPYMYWRRMRDKDYRRIHAGVQTYLNAPARQSDQCRVNYREPDRLEVWRKRTEGPLAGWYAALALHKRCFVSYSASEARVAASQERRVVVPLPPQAVPRGVEAISHDGLAAEHPCDEIALDGQPALRMWVPDAGDGPIYVRVRYDLKAP